MQILTEFTAVQAAQKARSTAWPSGLKFTAVQAAQKYQVGFYRNSIEFTAVQAAQKSASRPVRVMA